VSYRRLMRRLMPAAPLVPIALFPSTALAAGSGLSPLLPSGISPNGQDLYNLYNVISIPALVVFFLVEGLLLTIIIRDRRRRPAPHPPPPPRHGNRRLEVIWTVIPFLILVGIGGLSFNELQRDFVQPSSSDLDISVTAHQFGWTFDYPQGFTISSEGEAQVQPLVVPAGKLIRLKLDSTDVIHSWWVPDISGKTDAVPGYDNFTWFRIDHPGQWRGQCTELCGVGHNTMQIMVQALSPGDFNIWAAEEKSRAEATPTPSASPSASAAASASPSASPSPSPSPSARPSPSPSR
jgi:cytochrome c oxidase subunit II